MTHYGRPLQFGVSVVPEAASVQQILALVQVAEGAGLDLVGIQDHPYQRRFLDTWMLIATLTARTRRIRFFPNVANLPLRPPAMMAKAAASLDRLSDGRFELGLGAGAFWDAVEAMGGPRRTPGESVDALEEAIQVIRLAWSPEPSVSFAGRHYALHGYRPGPPPVHPIGIWLGAYRPRMLRLAGRLADGWVPSLAFLPPEQFAAAQTTVDEAAHEAGRAPSAIQRVYNVSGTIGTVPLEPGTLSGPVERWVDTLSRWAIELGIDTFIFWPAVPSAEQVERFAGEVVPAVRTAVARDRRLA